MRRILLSAIAFIMPMMAFAGNNDAYILSKIESSNESLKTAECVFTQTRAVPAAKTSVAMDGNFYFTNENKLALLYNKPAGEYFVVNGNTLSMNKGGKKTSYDLTKVPMMNSLVKTLFNCVQGRVRYLAVEVNADYAVEETSTAYVVTLTAKKKEVKGYAKIVLTYNKKTCILEEMLMEEFSGVTNSYKFSSIKKNVAVSDDKFAVK